MFKLDIVTFGMMLINLSFSGVPIVLDDFRQVLVDLCAYMENLDWIGGIVDAKFEFG